MDKKANILDQVKNKDTFQVPEGYFEKMTEEVLQKTRQLPLPAKEEISIWIKLKPFFYLAALFAGLYLMIDVLMKVTGNPETEQISTEITLEEEYLLSQTGSYELGEYLTTNY